MEYDTRINVASSDYGTKVIFCTDEFFAPAKRMLQPTEAVFIEDKFDDHGKWMDGWETRRRRDGGNDYCFIKLGVKSKINEFDVDTHHFTGNFVPGVEILGCCAVDATAEQIINNEQDFEWFNLISPKDLAGDSNNLFTSESNKEVTHLKMTMLPDGGIARLRVYGNICFDEKLFKTDKTNVISLTSGARAVYANNEHFGNLQNILAEHTPLTMADGWETRRRREPGNDWGVIELAKPAIVEEIIVDTKHFKGNYPDTFSINACNIKASNDKALIVKSMFWDELISQKKLSMDNIHKFTKKDILTSEPITHIRINIFPDGGIARLKLIGKFLK